MKKHKCPHCGEAGMAVHHVMLADLVGFGRSAKCGRCSKHGEHPGWMRTIISFFTIGAIFVLFAAIVPEGGPVTPARVIRSVLIAAALMAANAFLTQNVALLPVE